MNTPRPRAPQRGAPPRQVAVIGSGVCAQTSTEALLAEEVGRRLAQAEATVICGGRQGVMEAVSRGAARAGGSVVGIIPGTSAAEANPHCTQIIASGVGAGRNLAVVASGGVVIAIGGEWGTLSEIGHARSVGRVVVALRSWSLNGRGRMDGAPGVIAVDSAEEAVDAALEILDRAGAGDASVCGSKQSGHDQR